MRVENRRDFGGPWLGLQLVEQLGLADPSRLCFSMTHHGFS
jgi:hypothetical protein